MDSEEESNPEWSQRNGADSFPISPDDDNSDDDLSASRSGSTVSASSIHHDSDVGDNPYDFLGVTEIEDEALETTGLDSEEESNPEWSLSNDTDNFSIPSDDDDDPDGELGASNPGSTSSTTSSHED